MGASEDPESRARPVRDQDRHQRRTNRRVHRDARHVHDAHAHHRASLPSAVAPVGVALIIGQRECGDDADDLRRGPGDAERGGGVDAAVAAQAPVSAARDALQGYRGRAEGVVRPGARGHRAVGAEEDEERRSDGEEHGGRGAAAQERGDEGGAHPPARLVPSPRADGGAHLGDDAVDEEVEHGRAHAAGDDDQPERRLHRGARHLAGERHLQAQREGHDGVHDRRAGGEAQ